MAKILIVEDDAGTSDSLSKYLDYDRHTVTTATDGLQALKLLRQSDYDVIVLDWEMPGATGVEVCRQYREQGGKSHVIMLTGRGSISEKGMGFDAGADDYVTKPFNVQEISMRIKAALRRQSADSSPAVLTARDLCLETEHFRLTKGGRQIKLLPKEFALLEFLMRNPKRMWSTSELLENVWSADTNASEEAVQACIRRLRKKIDDDGAESIIQNVYGVGYKLEP